jgi:hypothetical protein
LRAFESLAVVLVLLTLSPVTAPFATVDLKGHPPDLSSPQAELLSAKASPDEDLLWISDAPRSLPDPRLFVLVRTLPPADEMSKRQIPSPILRL